MQQYMAQQQQHPGGYEVRLLPSSRFTMADRQFNLSPSHTA